VARAGGEIIGAVNVVRVPLTLAGRPIEAAWQQDTVVHPGWRGRGVGRRLVEAGAAGWDLSLGKGTAEPMYHLKRNSGFADAPHVNYLARVLAPVTRRGSVARRISFPFLFAAVKLRRQDHVRTGLTSRVLGEFDARFDALDETLVAAGSLAPRKDRTYLSWRYLTRADRRYRIIAAEDGPRLRGAVVLRAGSVPTGDAWIVDLVCDPGDVDAIDELLNAAFLELRRSGAGCVRAFASSGQARARLLGRGFMQTRETPRFTFRARPGLDLSGADWNFWHGDGDTELYR
jgi:hypothetical protein